MKFHVLPRFAIKKLKPSFHGAFLMFVSLILTSCYQVEMKDVGSDPEFSGVIGKRFRLKEDLLALGISSSKPVSQRADYIVLARKPGFGGPEVVSKSELKKGTVVEVVKVLAPKNSLDNFMVKTLSDKKGVYVVKEINSNQLGGQVIRIKLYGKRGHKLYGMDSYEAIK